eukprot:6596650-Pyramimonas_sp.AAC.1
MADVGNGGAGVHAGPLQPLRHTGGGIFLLRVAVGAYADGQHLDRPAEHAGIAGHTSVALLQACQGVEGAA